jgi:4-hydroxybenzoate polyprenyltransferase
LNSAKAVLHLVRVRQWAKNSLLFAGFIFAGRLREAGPDLAFEAGQVFLAFVCFCALSGLAYVINDWADIERDKLHPVKKNRPLASGTISQRGAGVIIVALSLVATACLAQFLLVDPQNWGFAIAAAAYFALTLAYSFILKHEVVIDVLSVAIGFVLRVVAGCLAIPVTISPWIVFCTFSLALFIALCKRRAELNEIGDVGTRNVLGHYTPEMLDMLIAVSAGLTIIGYSFYTFLASHVDALGNTLHGTPLLMGTIPFVVYGLFRYLFLAISTPVGGEPERMLRDVRMLVTVFLWCAIVVVLTLADKI